MEKFLLEPDLLFFKILRVESQVFKTDLQVVGFFFDPVGDPPPEMCRFTFPNEQLLELMA